MAKTLLALKKTFPKIELKMGLLEGDPDLIDVERLAGMKNRAETIGEAVMLLASPGRRLAGCVGGPAGRLAGCIKAIVEKQEAAAAEEPVAAGAA